MKKNRLKYVFLVLLLMVVVLFVYRTVVSNKSINKSGIVGTGCKLGGCNGELCLNKEGEELSSICLYQDKYRCYKEATCEKQDNGECGWTQTSKLKTCLGFSSKN